MTALLTAKMVAELLHVSRSTVYRYVEHEGLPAVRLSAGVVRFDPQALVAWIRAKADAA